MLQHSRSAAAAYMILDVEGNRRRNGVLIGICVDIFMNLQIIISEKCIPHLVYLQKNVFSVVFLFVSVFRFTNLMKHSGIVILFELTVVLMRSPTIKHITKNVPL